MNRSILLLIMLIQLMLPISEAAESYRVQVGDRIRVALPGEESLDGTYDVDRQGRILLPEIGAVEVSTLSESELEQSLRKQLSIVFRDLGGLQVYIKERRLLVNVLGYVEKPGEFSLPSDAGLQMALSAAGGIRSGAQLDRIQVRRGERVTTFNYKQYLDTGDDRMLPRLYSTDTIFVPASPMIGNVEVDFDPSKMKDAGDAAEDRRAIKVFGEVNAPGSFSYREKITLVDLLMRAGGVTRFGGVEQIRVITQGTPKLFNLKLYLDTGDDQMMPEIVPGATIFVPRQEEEIKAGMNTVYVMGEVFKPGAYESREGATFMDIIANAGGPTRFAETRQIRILKGDGTVIPFDLSGYTEGLRPEGAPSIMPGDAIFVPEKTDMNEKSWLKISPDRAVRVIGEVVKPGRFEWSDEMSLMDLLAHAGGPTSRADTANIEVATPNRNGQMVLTRFDLDSFFKQGGSESQLPKIRAGSVIRVHDLPQDPSDNKAQWVRQGSEKSIYVFGQVGAPGRYMFTEDMGFLDILAAADGPTRDADIRNIRISHRSAGHAKVSHLDLSIYFETGDESLLPKVRTGDTIYIPDQKRAWLEQPKEVTVRVLGAVNKPGRYDFNDHMTLLDLLAEAGGTTKDAYLERISVVNRSCCEQQASSFDLTEFARTGDFNLLPVIRAGDTLFVPDRSQSTVSQGRQLLNDIFQLVSLGALLGFL